LLGAANLGIREGTEEKYDVLGGYKYLINLDNETLGQLIRSSAGLRYF
jgi:hypothetical protein